MKHLSGIIFLTRWWSLAGVVKHFEDVWEQAEELAPKLFNKDKLNELIDNIDEPEVMGEILLLIAGLSKIHSINVWIELEKAINNFKIENYE